MLAEIFAKLSINEPTKNPIKAPKKLLPKNIKPSTAPIIENTGMNFKCCDLGYKYTI